ncbi:hypothetical protein CFC21_009437 [Triticum aestivum]|uniref:FHA domain-containing protein n=3 Tax=Triticum TaxID=4564 RepID=A0A9R0R652_TRITD|nr:hypothetical protein CFC21_009437 [Triticum aestivum]VAH23757.1 unnamed protein product [Triticum turgidum subsp. durum]
MATSTLKPGVPVTLQELAPSSEMFKQGASLRVTGMYVCLLFCFLLKTATFSLANLLGLLFSSLQSYDVDSAVAVIQDGSARLRIDTQHLRDISFRSGSAFQFIGELLIRPNDDVILQARVGRNVDGLDLNLYQQSLIIRRQHEAKLLSSSRV